MRGLERRCDLNGRLDRFDILHRAAQNAVAQGLALEILHGDEGPAVVLADLLDGGDVRVGKRGGGAGLAAQSLGGDRVGIVSGRQELEGDEAMKARVLRLIDHTHAAAADLLYDAVVCDDLRGCGPGIRHRAEC